MNYYTKNLLYWSSMQVKFLTSKLISLKQLVSRMTIIYKYNTISYHYKLHYKLV